MMSWGEIHETLSLGAVIAGLALAIAVVVWTAAALGLRAHAADRASAFVLIFAIAIVGSIVGFATGLSRTGVVGEVVPAVLVFFGGFSAYLFGVEAKKGALAALCLVAFSATFFIQSVESSRLRGRAEAEDQLREACFAQLTATAWSQNDYEAKNKILDCETVVGVVRARSRLGRLIPLSSSEIR
jgi:hypothetical protein